VRQQGCADWMGSHRLPLIGGALTAEDAAMDAVLAVEVALAPDLHSESRASK